MDGWICATALFGRCGVCRAARFPVTSARLRDDGVLERCMRFACRCHPPVEGETPMPGMLDAVAPTV